MPPTKSSFAWSSCCSSSIFSSNLFVFNSNFFIFFCDFSTSVNDLEWSPSRSRNFFPSFSSWSSKFSISSEGYSLTNEFFFSFHLILIHRENYMHNTYIGLKICSTWTDIRLSSWSFNHDTFTQIRLRIHLCHQCFLRKLLDQWFNSHCRRGTLEVLTKGLRTLKG